MEKIKLTDLQKATLEQTQNQKQQLVKMLQELEAKEAMIAGFIFDGKADLSKASNLKLEGDYVTFEIVEKALKEEAQKVGKVKKLKVE